MPKLKPGTIVPTLKEDSEITAGAMDDPDALPFSDEEWKLVNPKRSDRTSGESASDQNDSTS